MLTILRSWKDERMIKIDEVTDEENVRLNEIVEILCKERPQESKEIITKSVEKHWAMYLFLDYMTTKSVAAEIGI